MLTREIVNKIVKAIDFEEHSLVLLHFWGDDDELYILHMFEYAVAQSGASSITLQQSRDNNVILFNSMKVNSLGNKYYELFNPVDIIIDICMYQAVIPGEGMTPEGKSIYREHMQKIFTLFTSKKKFIQIRIPTGENAVETYLSEDEYITRMEKAYDIDYIELKNICKNKTEELKDKKEIILETGNGCMLRFNLEGRQWITDAGDGDFPCGEVYIAPNEQFTQGKIFFEKLYLEDIGVLTNITLKIENGKIVAADNEVFQEFITDLPEGGNVVCELGIGLNPNITDLTGYTVLDEKMAGTIHIGIGMNTLFGGKNSAPLHMDFVNAGYFRFV